MGGGSQAARARGRAGGVAAAVPDRRGRGGGEKGGGWVGGPRQRGRAGVRAALGRGGGGFEGHEPEAVERLAVQPLESPLRQPERSSAPTNAVGGQNCGRMCSGGTCKKYISAGGYGCKEKKPRMDFNSSMEDLRYKH